MGSSYWAHMKASAASSSAPFRCAQCGEPLFTETRRCPHCGALDSAMPTAGGPRIAPDRPAPERPAAAPTHSDGPADFGAGILPPGGHERSRGDDMVPDSFAYEESEPPRAASRFAPPRADAVIIPATRADNVGDRFEPRVGSPGPRKEAPRIDLTPETAPGSGGGGGAEPPLTLAVVPQRGDGSLVVYRRRPRRLLLWSGIALVVVIVAVGLGWRMASGPRGAAPIAVVEAGHDWAPLVADPATLGPGPRIVSATGPFRLRVDGTVYTILDSQPVTIPLEKAKSVEVKAIDGTAKVTITKP